MSTIRTAYWRPRGRTVYAQNALASHRNAALIARQDATTWKSTPIEGNGIAATAKWAVTSRICGEFYRPDDAWDDERKVFVIGRPSFQYSYCKLRRRWPCARTGN